MSSTIKIVAGVGITAGLVLLFWMMIPGGGDVIHIPPEDTRLNNLGLAELRMAMDHENTGNEALGWPGDLTSSSTPIRSVSELLQRLIDFGYLSATQRQELSGLSSASGLTMTLGDPKPPKNWAFKVYRVKASDGPHTIALATSNFTYGKGLDPKQKPLGDRFCVIVRKGGDRLVASKEMAKHPEIGLLPGRRNREDRPFETPEDTLKQE